MPNIVILGCGVLGRRHLEALGALKTPMVIWGIDPSDEALSLAEKHFMSTNQNNLHNLSLATCINKLPRNVDIVISATNSSARLKSLETMLNSVNTDHLVLEKVLFSRLSDFDLADELFKGKFQDIWVNCPRRANDTYARIKDKIRNARRVDIKVSGGSWGLASNSIHFIDLYAFLTDSVLAEVNTSKLEEAIYESKRDGFIELSGTIECVFNRGKLCLTADINGPLETEIEINADEKSLKINELEGTVHSVTKGHSILSDGSIELAPQSQLTALYVSELLSKSNLPLPGYKESVALHRPFLHACIEHQQRILGRELVDCRIT